MTRRTGPFALGIAVVIVIVALLAPALWNHYPLLQYDTGGYLARWYEGYLVPSRSTVFGIYLHLGEGSGFWLDLVVQAAAVTWIIHLTARVFGLARPLHLLTLAAVLILTTALPWITSMLLTDIFSGLAVLAVYLLVLHARRLGALEKVALFLLATFGVATHSATFAVLLGLCCAGWMVRPWLRRWIVTSGLIQASLSVVAGALLLLGTNFALSGQLQWTPGGYGILFGRMLEEGIATRYLDAHCPQAQFRLCPFRDQLPATADDFLWGKSVFNQLGRFDGLGDEMKTIVQGAVSDYPGLELASALKAAARQLVSVATGEGTLAYMAHTFGIIERYIPAQTTPMRAARQQHDELRFGWMNRIHVPVALASMLALLGLVAQACWRRRLDPVAMFAMTITLALLGNAVACGALSGPHDRYGARMVWLATFAVAIAIGRRLAAAAKVRAAASENP